MKTILKRLWRDKVSLGVLIFTIAFAIVKFAPFLYILILFIFRGIMWEGQYVEALDKYVTEPKYRDLLSLDKKTPTPIIVNLLMIVMVLCLIGAGIYIIWTR
jgi:hypothetical protein